MRCNTCSKQPVVIKEWRTVEFFIGVCQHVSSLAIFCKSPFRSRPVRRSGNRFQAWKSVPNPNPNRADLPPKGPPRASVAPRNQLPVPGGSSWDVWRCWKMVYRFGKVIFWNMLNMLCFLKTVFHQWFLFPRGFSGSMLCFDMFWECVIVDRLVSFNICCQKQLVERCHVVPPRVGFIPSTMAAVWSVTVGEAQFYRHHQLWEFFEFNLKTHKFDKHQTSIKTWMPGQAHPSALTFSGSTDSVDGAETESFPELQLETQVC